MFKKMHIFHTILKHSSLQNCFSNISVNQPSSGLQNTKRHMQRVLFCKIRIKARVFQQVTHTHTHAEVTHGGRKSSTCRRTHFIEHHLFLRQVYYRLYKSCIIICSVHWGSQRGNVLDLFLIPCS